MCKQGRLSPGKVTVTHEKGNFFIAIRDVPARVCDHCGHYYLESKTALRVESEIRQAMGKGVDIEVLRLQAV